MNRSDTSSPANGIAHRNTYSCSRESSVTDRFNRIADDEPNGRPIISSRTSSGHNSPRRELPGYDLGTRPAIGSRSASGFEGPTSLARDQSPAGMQRISRTPTDPLQLQGARGNLRITKRDNQNGVFSDERTDFTESPATTELSRITSWSTAGQDGSNVTKKPPPPPPPPSRATKPKPAPPLPMKRSALSTSEIPRY